MQLQVFWTRLVERSNSQIKLWTSSIRKWSGLKTDFIISNFIFLVSIQLFSRNLDIPKATYFDESVYVSAAFRFLKHEVNENWSHPPLGKMILAFGIYIFGNNPVGWRAMSVLFGSAIVVLIYLWAKVLFKDTTRAIECAVLTLLNQILFIQSRVGVIDIFMTGFLISGLTLLTLAKRRFDSDQNIYNRFFYGSLIAFSLSAACKWYAWIPAFFCVIYYLFKTNFPKRKKFGINFLLVLACLILPYAISFIPTIGMRHPTYAPALSSPVPLNISAPRNDPIYRRHYGISDFFTLHYQMLLAQLEFSNSPAVFNTSVFSWPLMLYPMWIAAEKRPYPNGDQYTRAIVWIGNPLIMWVGFLAIGCCLLLFWKKRDPVAGLIAGIYILLWLSWLLIPRKVTLSYYYLPAALILSLAIPYTFKVLKFSFLTRINFILAATLVMLYFYPWLVGDPLTPQQFQERLWFSSWKNAPPQIAALLPF